MAPVARWRAIRDALHAVSRVIEGPVRLSAYEILLERLNGAPARLPLVLMVVCGRFNIVAGEE
jgi:hypothetical protein